MTLNHLRLTVALVEHRNAMRKAGGERYEEDSDLARSVIRRVAAEKRISLAAATLEISRTMERGGVDPSLILAAFVDESEATA